MTGSKERIRKYLSGRDLTSGAALRRHLGISRQALSVHLRALIASGEVVKSGSTRGARYGLASRAAAPRVVARSLALKGLSESDVYEGLAASLDLGRQLRPNVEAILRYAFTEMLNNAIEHSEAARGGTRLELARGAVRFEVRDPGIGVFASIAGKLGLPDEQTALVELLKGRTTTAPAAHTGEGLFFTSRVADRFELRSHRIQLDWDNLGGDVFVSRKRFVRGTRVRFFLLRSNRRRIESVFSEFAPPEYDFQFQKTEVRVRLVKRDYVSRSEAKRLLANLGKFREVALDFAGVESVGQGFADEVFRVFARAHPEVKLVIRNADPVVEAMLRHAGGRPST